MQAARGGIDDYNARQVEKRAGATIAELLDEFAANRAKTVADGDGRGVASGDADPVRGRYYRVFVGGAHRRGGGTRDDARRGHHGRAMAA